jgi:hypothetical protein
MHIQRSRRDAGRILLGLAASSWATVGCGGGVHAYPQLTSALISAVNHLYVGEFVVSTVSASVPPNEHSAASAAAQLIMRECNEGAGTTVVAIGQVRVTAGPGVARVNLGQDPIWAVFVNPKGQHIAPSSGRSTGRSRVLNWYAGFVTTRKQPFCSFGYSSALPRLPTH